MARARERERERERGRGRGTDLGVDLEAAHLSGVRAAGDAVLGASAGVVRVESVRLVGVVEQVVRIAGAPAPAAGQPAEAALAVAHDHPGLVALAEGALLGAGEGGRGEVAAGGVVGRAGNGVLPPSEGRVGGGALLRDEERVHDDDLAVAGGDLLQDARSVIDQKVALARLHGEVPAIAAERPDAKGGAELECGELCQNGHGGWIWGGKGILTFFDSNSSKPVAPAT